MQYSFFRNKLLITIVSLYIFVSLLVFNKVYITSKSVIDELFHLRQGLAYCNLNFTGWDPKITTLPGLYMYSTIFCNVFGNCSIYCLRLSSFVISLYNLYLFNSIKKLLEPKINEKNCLATALNLSILPPLYFFSHVYYTDVPSLACVLGLYYYGMKRKAVTTSIFGIIAILMRQTNIIYIGLIAGLILIGHTFNSLYKTQNSSKEVILSISELDITKRSAGWSLEPYSVSRYLDLLPFYELALYGNICVAFLVFVYLNEGIVVGDKSAHAATVHVPQIFYFSLFYLVFAWPHCVRQVKPFLLASVKYWPAVVICTILSGLIVYSNTIVHPYLLADNRHYVFYIWKRIYAILIIRYLMIPIHIFGLYCIFKLCYNPNDVRFTLLFLPISTVVLILQRLLEIRYFLVPYVLLRLQFRGVSKTVLGFEFLTYVGLNACTFYIFFTKEVKWVDFDEIQRIIW